jgi:hypothetical protein
VTRRLASVSVRTDVRRAVLEIRDLRETVATKATFRALNRSLDKVATETGREIRKVYNVRQRAITSALRKRRAHSKSLFARLIVEGVRLGLIEFAARAVNPWNVKGRRRKPGGGVSVQVKVGGGRKLIQGAFITAASANNATGGGSEGMRQVWRRAGAARLPIKNLRSLSVPQAFANQAVLAALRRVADETFHKNFSQQIRFLTGGR